MRDLKSYININRWFMTSREMADELAIPMHQVQNILQKNKWEAVNDSDRIKEYLMENPGVDIKDVAARFGKTPQLVYMIKKKLKDEGFVAPVRIEAPDPGPLCEQGKEWLEWAEEEGYGVIPIPRTDRVKEAYTQSASPFGLADELKNIKTSNP